MDSIINSIKAPDNLSFDSLTEEDIKIYESMLDILMKFVFSIAAAENSW
jgi:hypothetical protein